MGREVAFIQFPNPGGADRLVALVESETRPDFPEEAEYLTPAGFRSLDKISAPDDCVRPTPSEVVLYFEDGSAGVRCGISRVLADLGAGSAAWLDDAGDGTVVYSIRCARGFVESIAMCRHREDVRSTVAALGLSDESIAAVVSAAERDPVDGLITLGRALPALDDALGP